MANVFRALARSLTPLSSLNDPSVPLYQAIANGIDGISIDGAPGAGLPGVTPESAVRITAVYRAVSLIASISRLPLHVFERDGVRRREVTDVRERVIWGRPNPEVSRSVFWETVISHVALAGNAYIYAPANGLGDVGELWPIVPQRVEVGRDPVTRRKVFIVDGDRSAPFMGCLAADRDGGRGEIIHVPGLSFNGLVGVNPIRAARLAAQLAIAAETYGVMIFSQGSLPGGVITTEAELDPEEAAKTLALFAEMGGAFTPDDPVVH
jgi:HK97 family phage portal protein